MFFAVKRDVVQIQSGRARIHQVLKMQRAIREIHGVHRAAPLVRAVEQHRDGVGDRAQQQQNPAGRVRRGGDGFGGFQGVDGSVLVALQKQLRADGGHRIHFGLSRFQVHARAGDGKVRQFDNVVGAARSGELEIAQGKGRVRDGCDAVAGASSKR